MFKFEKDKKYEIDYLFYSKHTHGHVLILRDYNYFRGVLFSSIYETIKGVSTLLSSNCSVSINLNEIIVETRYHCEIFRIYQESL